METPVNNINALAPDDRLFFKRVDEQLKHPKAPKGVNTISERSQKKVRIFLVDDDPLFLKGLELSISGNIGPLIIDTFQSGEECLQHMKMRPSIVVLDYFLNPNNVNALNGLKVLKEIKQLYPKTKVIMLSAQDSLDIAIDCIDNGAYDYISKSHSSLIRINNIIKNIVGDIRVTSGFFEALELILLVIVFALIAGFIVSH